jgi:hypothetical protein
MICFHRRRAKCQLLRNLMLSKAQSLPSWAIGTLTDGAPTSVRSTS